jgi:two-component system, LytTR family, sensor kinase
LQEAPLARELEVVRSYLEIEQARLGPRLSVCLDVGADALDACVPTFLLQPLVENSIRHGIAPRAAPGRIEVRARRDRDWLHLEVRDDGLGLPAQPASGGVGLTNTRARLFHLYGEAQRLEACNDPRGGCVVQVTLPYREQVETSVEDVRDADDRNADRG